MQKKSDFTLYVNPYLVVQNGGRYTKHIYIGAQRIVSKLGDFDSYGADPRRVEKAGESFSGVKVNYDAKYKKALEVVKENYATLDVPYYGTDNNDYVNGLGFCCNPAGDTNSGNTTGKMTAKNDNAELQQFYYHPDHLGSSSYISNLDGEVVQHIEYVPFGEVFLEEKNSKWNTPYLFTSNELDKETGMYYMSARYQDPKLGIFISVDPLAEKFKGWSSYTYAFNNPLNLIDPTGMGPEDPPTVWSKIKTYADYQWNTKIPNDLKKIGRELDNGWRMKLKDGFDFRSSLRNGESYDKVPKEKGTRDTQVVDITGIDILSTYVGLSTGTKTVSKSGKIVDVLSDFAKAVKSTPDGWTIGQNVGEMINQTTIEITNTFYSDNVNQVSGKRYVTERVSVTKDTTINLKDRQQVLLNQNKKNEKRREQEQRKLEQNN